MRRDELHTMHQFQHLGRVVGAGLTLQHWETSLDDAVRGVVWRASRLRRRVFPPAWEGWTGILSLEPVNDGLDALNVLISNVVLGTELRRDVDVGDVVAGC